jgi:hypothetical protein
MQEGFNGGADKIGDIDHRPQAHDVCVVEGELLNSQGPE